MDEPAGTLSERYKVVRRRRIPISIRLKRRKIYRRTKSRRRRYMRRYRKRPRARRLNRIRSKIRKRFGKRAKRYRFRLVTSILRNLENLLLEGSKCSESSSTSR